MKKFLVKILLFFIAVALVDVIYGYACQYMNDHSKGGGIKSRYYVCKESNEDVLIFGSSRAKHHYVPDIIEDSLNVTCYNAGEDGNGIILSYGFLKMITQRYSPKLIIYDVSAFDIYEDDNIKYLDLMKPYYHEPGIDSIFWTVKPITKIMMKSNLYRFNTTCLRVLGNYIRPMTSYPKGYSPLLEVMDYEPEIKESGRLVVDSLKIHFFQQFIMLARNKGIKLICCVTPTYKCSSNDEYYLPLEKLCQQFDIPFLYYANPVFTCEKKFFQDKIHMNHTGAVIYTRDLSSRISDYLKEE